MPFNLTDAARKKVKELSQTLASRVAFFSILSYKAFSKAKGKLGA